MHILVGFSTLAEAGHLSSAGFSEILIFISNATTTEVSGDLASHYLAELGPYFVDTFYGPQKALYSFPSWEFKLS